MSGDQLQLHPAAEIFVDYILSDVEAENRKLREANDRLGPSRDFIASIDLRLRGGRVITASLTSADESEDYLCVPVESDPEPLVEFSEGAVAMRGQPVDATLPGVSHTLLGIRENGTALVRFSLSAKVAVEGSLQGLSDCDVESFRDGMFLNWFRPSLFDFAFASASGVTFKPTMVIVGTHELRGLELLRPLPPADIIKHNLRCYRGREGHSGNDMISPSDELRRTVVAAMGCTDLQMELLVRNNLLESDNKRLQQIRGLVETFKILHVVTGFKANASLGNGSVHRLDNGNSVWRVALAEMTHLLRPRLFIQRRLWVLFLSGESFQTVMSESTVNDGAHMLSIQFQNGVKMQVVIRRLFVTDSDFDSDFIGSAEFSVDFPLSLVEPALEALGKL